MVSLQETIVSGDFRIFEWNRLERTRISCSCSFVWDTQIMSSSDDENADWATITSSLGLNAVSAVVVLCAFVGLTMKMPALYNARKYHSLYGGGRALSLSDHTLVEIFRIVYAMEDTELVEKIGLDAYVLVRFSRLCARFCFFSTISGFVVLVPCFATGHAGEHGIFRLSASNLADSSSDNTDNATNFGSVRVWFVIVMLWTLVLWLLYDLNLEFKHFVRLRQNWLVKGDKSIREQCRYSIMLENIPPTLRSDKALASFFRSLFPGQVHSAVVCLNIDHLVELVEKRRRTHALFENAISESRRLGGKDATHTSCRCVLPWSARRDTDEDSAEEDVKKSAPTNNLSGEDGACRRNCNCALSVCCIERKEIDSLAFYAREIERLNAEIEKQQQQHMETLRELRKRDQVDHRGLLLDVLGSVVRNTTTLAEMFGEKEEESKLPPVEELLAIRIGGDEKKKRTRSVASSTDEETGDEKRGEEGEEEKREASNRSKVTALERAADVSLGALAASGNIVGRTAATVVHRAAVGLNVATTTLTNIALGSKSSSTGFVTFKRLEDAATASQCLLTPVPNSLDATLAPQSRDLIWGNVAIPKDTVDTRTMFMDIAFGAGAILWSTIVTGVYFLGSLDNLSKIFTFLDDFKDSALYISVQGWYVFLFFGIDDRDPRLR